MSPEARRQAIVEAVAPILLERGPDLSTKQIAEAAGVAEGTLFRVFEDKRELLLATCWHVMRPEATRGWLGEPDPTLSLAETVRQVVGTMCVGVERMGRVLVAARALGEQPHGHQPATTGRPSPAFFEKSNREVVARIADRLRPYAAEMAVPPARAAVMVRALVLGSSHPFAVRGQRVTPDEITQVLLHGLTRSAGESGRQ
jgi:AcrR family transcriptional regulator